MMASEVKFPPPPPPPVVVTVMVVVPAVAPARLAVITVEPAATAVTIPVELTEATPELLVDHATRSVTSWSLGG